MLFLLFSLAHCCYFLLFIVALLVYLFVVGFSTLSLFLLLVVCHTLFWFSVANKFVVAIVVVVVVACFNYFFAHQT